MHKQFDPHSQSLRNIEPISPKIRKEREKPRQRRPYDRSWQPGDPRRYYDKEEKQEPCLAYDQDGKAVGLAPPCRTDDPEADRRTFERLLKEKQREEMLSIVNFKTGNDDIDSLFSNSFISRMCVGDWAKMMSKPAEFMNVAMLRSAGIAAFQNEEAGCPLPNTNNSSGWDALIVVNDRQFRVQIKLREVQGRTPTSRQILIDTTRRTSGSNQTAVRGTQHVPYNVSEFDFVLINIVHTNPDIEKRKNPRNWTYLFMPSKLLLDPTKDDGSLLLAITPRLMDPMFLLETDNKNDLKEQVMNILSM